tara:strand:+ start:335 stop:832 length:498 start_codon:yes stop_codon:yes gene_type:complete
MATASPGATAGAAAGATAAPSAVDDAASVQLLAAPDAEELISAAKDLLRRAGMPMEATEADIRSELLQARQEAAQAKQTAAEVVAKTRLAKGAIACATEAMKCQICMENPCDAVLIPSRRLICRDCAQRCVGRPCPFTRIPVERFADVLLPVDELAAASTSLDSL